MHHHKSIFLIILFVIMPFGFAVSGELTIYSSEGVQTLSTPDPEPSNTQPDKYKKIGEKCIENCDEGKVLPKVRSGMSDRNYAKRSEVISFTTYDIDHSTLLALPGGLVVRTPKIERCAHVVFRNNARPGEARGKRLIREWDFKATFANGETIEGKRIEANSYSIGEGETSTANVCFGISNYPIVAMDCDF